MQDVARVVSREMKQEGPMSATGMSGEAATTTIVGSAAWAQQPHVTQVGGHAPSSLSRLFVAGAGLVDDEARNAGGAERQQPDDDGEGEPPQAPILALDRGWASGASW